MKKTAVIIETKDGVIKEANYGMITCAAKDDAELYAFIINENSETFKKELGSYGVTHIVDICIESDNHENHESHDNKQNPEIDLYPYKSNSVKLSDAIAQAVKNYDISSIFGLTTPMGREILPRVAAELEAPLVMDCLDVINGSESSLNSDSNLDLNFDLAKTSLYSGKTIATVKVTGDIRLFGIRPNVIEPSSKLDLTQEQLFNITVEKFIAKNRYAQQNNIKLIESKKGDSSGNDLVAADVIISGGRAMKNGENFKLLYDCAEAIEKFGACSAAVGASRVAVDLGWVPYRMQVGQTGEKVSPKVYIACGISGSIQHFAGMKMSGMIIAINENINAAIMSNCDYFVEADLFEILPMLHQELRSV